MITKFNTYLNESIRDKMMPRSEEEIKKRLDNLNSDDLFYQMNHSKINFLDFYTKEKLIEKFKQINNTSVWLNVLDSLIKKHFQQPNNVIGYLKYKIDINLWTRLKRSSNILTPTLYGDLYSFKDLFRFFKKHEIVSIFSAFLNKETLNESVRDMMKPKSKEEIKKSINHLNKEELNQKLLIAVRRQQIPLVEALLELEADPNYKNKEGGNTILFTSTVGSITTNPNLEIIKLLLEYGGDPTIPNVRGIMTLKFAEYWKNLDVAKLLKQYMNTKEVKTNESIIDKMTPKPEEEIRKKLTTKLAKILKYAKENIIDFNYTDPKDIGEDVCYYLLGEYRHDMIYDVDIEDDGERYVEVNSIIEDLINNWLKKEYPEWDDFDDEQFWGGFKYNEQ